MNAATEEMTDPEGQGAEEITRSARSNLAAAFACLPKDRRADATILYAFCRTVDDIADDPDLAASEKRSRLERWKEAVVSDGSAAGKLGRQLVEMRDRRGIKSEDLVDIIVGMEMDIRPCRYQTFSQLKEYCYRAASAVGLASIEVFGYQNPSCREYAVNLGYALQMTNILRDVGQDIEVGRIYLPEEDCERFGYGEKDFSQKIRDDRFLDLVRFEVERIREFHRQAEGSLAAEDRRSMRAARMMSQVYREILAKMERDGFRVFEKRYRLSKARLLWIVGNYWLRSKLRP